MISFRIRSMKASIVAGGLVLLATWVLSLALTSMPTPSQEIPGRGSQDLDPRLASSNCLISSGHLLHIPGPNPAIVTGGKEEWDGSVIESCDMFEDFGTYYWYYHGVPVDKARWPRIGYRVGVATSAHPTGPFVKHNGNPILDLGPEGSWEDSSVACAFLLKEGVDKYYMWYSGNGLKDPYRKWSIGLATASNPLGPWKKYPGNPIVNNFGYVGGVVRHNGKYFLYTEHPIGSTAPDYGPISLATADKPEGPWHIWEGNPVLKAGDWGAWDDGGFSESKVVFWEGIFHIFYGGAKRYEPRMLTRESIGYAYSFDGYRFYKYARNPVARRDDVPNAAAFGEVHCLLEPPFVYLYHTLRYVSSPNQAFPRVEDLGYEILALRDMFRVAMPVLKVDSLAGLATSSLQDASAINLGNVSTVALTVEATYHASATAGVRVHVRGSSTGSDYDTADLSSFENDFKAGQVGRRTVSVDARSKFIKVLVENLDTQHPVTNIKVDATLGGQ